MQAAAGGSAARLKASLAREASQCKPPQAAPQPA